MRLEGKVSVITGGDAGSAGAAHAACKHDRLA
jgi:hypothetical protein